MQNKKEIIENLRHEIGQIEWSQDQAPPVYSTGMAEIDRQLKHQGLCRGSLHEIFYADQGAPLGFLLSLLSKVIKKNGPIFWCTQKNSLYTPGFLRFGIKENDIIFIESHDQKQSLWVTEQALLCTDFSAVVSESLPLNLSAGRRLKLVAQKNNTTAFFLINNKKSFTSSSVASTRWKISSLASQGQDSRNGIKGVGPEQIQIELIKNTGGKSPFLWRGEFNEKNLCFYILPQFLSSNGQSSAQNRNASFDQGAKSRPIY